MFLNIDDNNIVSILCSLGLNKNDVKDIHDEVYELGYVFDEQLTVQKMFQDLLDKNNIKYTFTVDVKNRSGLPATDPMADEDDDYFVYNII